MRELDPLDLVETIRDGLLVLDTRIPGLAGWSKPCTTARRSGRTGEQQQGNHRASDIASA
jgi:hypothetical protein